MSRKHFIALAAAIAEIESKKARRVAAEKVAAACRRFNPRFNYERFLRACGVEN